jgi:hypothetical protein
VASEFIAGFRLSEIPGAPEVLELALSEAKASLEAYGAVLKSWDYDDAQRLLLVHIRAEASLLEQATKDIAVALSRVAGVNAKAEKLSQEGFARARSVVPSPPVMGFLLRLARSSLEGFPLGREELLALLLLHFSGNDKERALLTAPFLGISAEAINSAFEKLVDGKYIDPDTCILLKPAERLLNAVIPVLRARSSMTQESIKVLDEEGNVETFSVEKLAASLYGSGIPHSLIPTVLSKVRDALQGKSAVSKRNLVAIVSSLLEDLEPAASAAAKFTGYVYALDKAFVSIGGGLKKLKWGFLRELSFKVLSERGLAPPHRLTKLHADFVADEVRAIMSSAPWKFEGYVFELEELERIARHAAPKVSATWLELGSHDASLLASEYMSRGIGYAKAAMESIDCAERKELAVRGAFLFSSALLISMKVLPSNYVGVNVGALRGKLKMLPENIKSDVARFCSLTTSIARSPAIATPREDRKLLGMLKELDELMDRLKLERTL